jgi:hypothetical protein
MQATLGEPVEQPTRHHVHSIAVMFPRAVRTLQPGGRFDAKSGAWGKGKGALHRFSDRILTEDVEHRARDHDRRYWMILEPEDIAGAARFLSSLSPLTHVPELLIKPAIDNFS